ncbi:MAG: GNAT family N-acetyltransferase [Xanthobacteraceae bacterium]|nr:GNAT family N-acetyltransferase [Xanthobacteraceae bacterium]
MTAQETQMPVNAAFGGRLGNFTARVGGRLRLGLSAKFRRYGLRRDLTLFFENPVAKISIAIRPLQSRDLASLFASNNASDSAERLEIAWRRAFVDKGARGGFVAVDSRNDLPCYVQWLFGARDNEFIRKLGGFPPLQSDQALLENAYTPPAYRGLGIMSAAMALIAERAIDLGAHEVQTFVDEHNIASLKGCQRAGFHPHLLHYRTRLCFGLITRDSFGRLPDDDPRRSTKF